MLHKCSQLFSGILTCCTKGKFVDSPVFIFVVACSSKCREWISAEFDSCPSKQYVCCKIHVCYKFHSKCNSLQTFPWARSSVKRFFCCESHMLADCKHPYVSSCIVLACEYLHTHWRFWWNHQIIRHLFMNQIISQMLTVKSSPLAFYQSMHINLHNKILVCILSAVIVQSNKSENQRKKYNCCILSPSRRSCFSLAWSCLSVNKSAMKQLARLKK